MTLPCRLFGTANEGACGYGALMYAILIGPPVAALCFCATLYLGLRNKSKDSAANEDKVIVGLWLVLFAALLLLPATLRSLGFVTAVLSAILTGALTSASMIMAKRTGRHPALGLTCLVPMIGPLIVIAVLWKRALLTFSPSTPNDLSAEEAPR